MKARFAVLLAACAAFGAAQAQTKWDMPTPYSDGEFHTRNVKAFAEDKDRFARPTAVLEARRRHARELHQGIGLPAREFDDRVLLPAAHDFLRRLPLGS